VAETSMSRGAAEQLVAYLAAGRAALGALPRKDLLIAERFFDEGGGMQLVIHAPLGGRLNRAWGLALRKRFCRGFNFELQAAATDDGIVISLGQPHSFPLATVFGYVPSNLAEDVLVQALLDQPMFEVRWRWNVTRALAVARRHGRQEGRAQPGAHARRRSAERGVPAGPGLPRDRGRRSRDPRSPAGARHLPRLPDRGARRRRADRAVRGDRARRDPGAGARRGRAVAAVSHELLNANPYAFLDDAPLEERRTRAVNLRRGLPPELAETTGALAPEAIAAAEDEVAPVVRDPDELHDALQTAWLVPVGARRDAGADRDLARGPGHRRPRHAPRPGRPTAPARPARPGSRPSAWPRCARVVPDADATPALATPAWGQVLEPEVALRRIVAAHLDGSGPRTARRAGRASSAWRRRACSTRCSASRPTATSCAAGSPAATHGGAATGADAIAAADDELLPASSGATAASWPASTA
jgi:ATP-dependent Lhr-like helicase